MKNVLGKKVDSPKEYAPDILVAIDRDENRSIYQIDSSNLSFVGFDSWHAYEISFLTNGGVPVHLVAKIVYPANSKYIVESKSLKLYLNSLNMMKLGGTVAKASAKAKELITNDLAKLLSTNVTCYLFSDSPEADILKDFPAIESIVDLDSLSCEAYDEDLSLLETQNDSTAQKFSCSMLRSNCKITNQPDWGTVFVCIKGEQTIIPESFIRYIVSFRNENHFHEEVCEMIYKRLHDLLSPKELMVTCIYTRRGGIDICPSRASSADLLDSNLINSKVLTKKLINQ